MKTGRVGGKGVRSWGSSFFYKNRRVLTDFDFLFFEVFDFFEDGGGFGWAVEG